ncbi:hypothetical protein E1B28_008318 [Marasmius oreades]|uniref:phosphatidylinositol-3,4,5-trisphosphate 3-phosphatase n=1 Tax=Marasmius oreades TaxID=181124 RepID=A0A9P7USA0_9AGAR|nr:uncharacterized protein E1B28_008318 [Marasmius oreades]KAG7091925.1 hypothetical protein E1B28_008318 [Marasmius oreades]
MTDYVRRLVSGKKARFKDHKLDVELDLVYLTDQVIIMGYPASGVEGLYRNRREDVKKFLDHRHGKNYWIFNFCPIKENSYDSQYFEGRVSRYPFPDHHAPPLALMPLVAREMRSWLDGSSERVAVLHCKAGKGRSGTMACAYLLSLNSNPAIPLEKSYSTKEWAAKRADDAMDIIPPDDDRHSTESSITDQTTVESPVQADSSPQSNTTPNHSPMALKHVLDLHTSRRMKQPLTSDKKVKQGVSIPSQRRYLYYWSLILSHQAPTHLWSNDPLMPSAPPTSTPKVRLAEIKLRTKESGGMTFNLVRAANAILDRGSTSKGSSQVWVSLARYDDDLIELLEKWERYTRDEANVGRRRPGTRDFGSETLNDIFEGGKWDKSKMVRSFARLGCSDDNDITKSDNGKVIIDASLFSKIFFFTYHR